MRPAEMVHFFAELLERKGDVPPELWFSSDGALALPAEVTRPLATGMFVASPLLWFAENDRIQTEIATNYSGLIDGQKNSAIQRSTAGRRHHCDGQSNAIGSAVDDV